MFDVTPFCNALASASQLCRDWEGGHDSRGGSIGTRQQQQQQQQQQHRRRRSCARREQLLTGALLSAATLALTQQQQLRQRLHDALQRFTQCVPDRWRAPRGPPELSATASRAAAACRGWPANGWCTRHVELQSWQLSFPQSVWHMLPGADGPAVSLDVHSGGTRTQADAACRMLRSGVLGGVLQAVCQRSNLVTRLQRGSLE